MEFNVQGMTCSHCERAITRAIASLGGTARVDIAGGTVEVQGVDEAARVRAAIESAGYQVADANGVAAAAAANAAGSKNGGCCGTRANCAGPLHGHLRSRSRFTIAEHVIFNFAIE